MTTKKQHTPLPAKARPSTVFPENSQTQLTYDELVTVTAVLRVHQMNVKSYRNTQNQARLDEYQKVIIKLELMIDEARKREFGNVSNRA